MHETETQNKAAIKSDYVTVIDV